MWRVCGGCDVQRVWGCCGPWVPGQEAIDRLVERVRALNNG